MKPIHWGISLLALVLASGAFYVLPRRDAPDPRSANPAARAANTVDATAPAVSVVKVTTADFVETVLITGSVVARDEVMVAPEIEGQRIESLAAEEGDAVTKGQLLAGLASFTLDAQMAQSEAGLARAEANIAVARSAIVQAEATLKEATNAFDRAKPLKETGVVSGATFDQRESAAATSRSKLASANDSLKSAQADKAVAEAQRRELAWKRSRTEIRSPVDGIVSRRTARVGAVATALNEPLFRIIARGEVELDAEVAESDLPKIREGQHASVTVTGIGEVTGTVRLVSGEVDRSTRIGKVKVLLGARPDLRLGAFGRGSIVTAKSRGLAVPTSAVVYAAEGAVIQVVKNGRVESRRVKTGLKTQTAIEIAEGLADGETIVSRSGSFLRHGDAVRPVFAETKVSGVP